MVRLSSAVWAIIGVWLFSVTDSGPRAAIDKAGFEAQEVRSETGIGAAGATAH